MKRISPIAYHLLLIACLSCFAIWPLFHLGFFPMHDDTQVARVSQLAAALQDGQLPVRWVADLGYGYGYPLFNFYAPLAYYVGGFLNLVGFDALVATKMMFGLGIILAGVSMYFLAKEFWGRKGGVVAALFYVYAPYHAVQIYVRGSVGELWAYAFLPLVFLGDYRIFKVLPGAVLLAGLSLAAVILSHNLTALMLVPFLGIVLVILFFTSKNKKSFLILNSKFIILALGASAFYWLPALTEMRFTKVFGQLGGGADWRDHFVFPNQLWTGLWGFGGSAPGRLDGMSFAIGKLHWLAIGVSVALLICQICRGDPDGRLARLGGHKARSYILAANLAIFGLAIFLLLPLSSSVWQLVKPMAFIQYPWRFLVFAVLAASFAAGSLASLFPKTSMIYIIVSIALAAGVIGFNQKYFQPQKDISPDYLSEMNIKWTTSKVSDEYLPRDFPVPASQEEVAWQKVMVLSGQAQISQTVFKAHDYRFQVDAQTDSQVLVNLAYFPGWKVWIDDQPTEPQFANGKVLFNLPASQYQVKFHFANTPVRRVANLVSLASGLFLIIIGFHPLKQPFRSLGQ